MIDHRVDIKLGALDGAQQVPQVAQLFVDNRLHAVLKQVTADHFDLHNDVVHVAQHRLLIAGHMGQQAGDMTRVLEPLQ